MYNSATTNPVVAVVVVVVVVVEVLPLLLLLHIIIITKTITQVGYCIMEMLYLPFMVPYLYDSYLSCYL